MIDFNAQKLVQDLKYLATFFVSFLKNPIESIKRAPDFDWQQVLLLQVVLSAISGALSGVVGKSLILVVWGIVIFPLVGVLISFLVSLCLHYLILYFFQREFEIRRTYTILVLANIPFLVLRIASPLVHTIDLLGLIFLGFLLVVGLVENYHLEKKRVIRLVFYLVLFIVLSWLVQYGYFVYQDWKRLQV